MTVHLSISSNTMYYFPSPVVYECMSDKLLIRGSLPVLVYTSRSAAVT
jgi:hypothetical protein